MSRYNDKAVFRAVGQAMHRFGMLSDGDRVMVALSGGADSWTLLAVLHDLKRRAPIGFDVLAVHVDLGFPGGCAELVQSYCHGAGWPVRVERTDYGVRAHGPENTESPCFLCARLRRKRLFELAGELGYPKVALGHNLEDLLETLFLNMCFVGELSTMVPKQPLFGGAVTLLRPLAFAEKHQIKRFAADRGLPVTENPCPSAARSRRTDLRGVLDQLYRLDRKVKSSMLRSLLNVNPDYLPGVRAKARGPAPRAAPDSAPAGRTPDSAPPPTPSPACRPPGR